MSRQRNSYLQRVSCLIARGGCNDSTIDIHQGKVLHVLTLPTLTTCKTSKAPFQTAAQKFKNCSMLLHKNKKIVAIHATLGDPVLRELSLRILCYIALRRIHTTATRTAGRATRNRPASPTGRWELNDCIVGDFDSLHAFTTMDVFRWSCTFRLSTSYTGLLLRSGVLRIIKVLAKRVKPNSSKTMACLLPPG